MPQVRRIGSGAAYKIIVLNEAKSPKCNKESLSIRRKHKVNPLFCPWEHHVKVTISLKFKAIKNVAREYERQKIMPHKRHHMAHMGTIPQVK